MLQRILAARKHVAIGIADGLPALDETKVYTIATATAVTGDFANVALPNKWKAFPQATRVVIGYANGTLLVFR